jgi:predicted transcriptional regulator
MTTITLKSDLTRQIEQLAGTQQTEQELFIDKAVRQYIAQLRQEKIRAESLAFDAQVETLASQYPNQYVAMHHGEVIDHDPDIRALHLRIFARMGHTPVLLKKVNPTPQQELTFRSPRFERV